jgi:hypothetical protein
MRPAERRQGDSVKPRPERQSRIVESDEKQHFNPYGALTLSCYANKFPLAFPDGEWITRSEPRTRLEGGGFGTLDAPAGMALTEHVRS